MSVLRRGNYSRATSNDVAVERLGNRGVEEASTEFNLLLFISQNSNSRLNLAKTKNRKSYS